MTQNQKILQHMRLHGSITPLEALRDYGCMRLAARIADLRKDGVLITAELEKGVNRGGEKIVYTRYRIAEG
jgi:hypothetical protein